MASENAYDIGSAKTHFLKKHIEKINMSIKAMETRHNVQLTILTVITVISFVVTFL